MSIPIHVEAAPSPERKIVATVLDTERVQIKVWMHGAMCSVTLWTYEAALWLDTVQEAIKVQAAE